MHVSPSAHLGVPRTRPDATATAGDAGLRKVARDFEKMFVAEMLRLTELGGTSDGLFAGGFGEEAFQSFLIDAYADQIAETGQFGIADTIFHALSRSEGQ